MGVRFAEVKEEPAKRAGDTQQNAHPSHSPQQNKTTAP